MTASILIVEDEEPIQLLLSYNLESEGYKVRVTASGEDVAALLDEEPADLVLLDWMLPDISGIEVCRAMRVIMLTARGEESERVRGLATGADDYVVKPFSVPELMARIRSILRRSNPEAMKDVLAMGDLSLDRVTRRVMRGPRSVNLSPTEFRLLEYLLTSPGRVYSRTQLLDHVWGDHVFVEERTVDVHIRRLRMALEPSGHDALIETVRGAGYRLHS